MSRSLSRRGPRLSEAQRRAVRRRENLDLFLGVLGFFTVMLLVATVVAEVKGEPALMRALTLAVFAGLVAVTLRIRRELERRVAAAMAAQQP